ncbi:MULTISPECIES: hypothetical protein [Pseudomonas]|uniref:hypothetical protein n=1 Tax=Pseudomonas TaxID=286 RepID=UPI00058B18A8|nr:hypothetical protein [Pseudomonas massiliensis]
MDTSLAERRARIERAQPALQHLDVAMQHLRYDPALPASVTAARAQVERLTQELLADFHEDPLLGQIAASLKAQYLDSIQPARASDRSAA